jgi:hypothetical protein
MARYCISSPLLTTLRLVFTVSVGGSDASVLLITVRLTSETPYCDVATRCTLQRSEAREPAAGQGEQP